MIRLIKASCTIAVIIFVPAALACDYPQRISIPSGSSATKDEMVAVQKDVKKFMAAIEEYLACIEDEDEQNRAGIEEPDLMVEAQRDEMLIKKHNAAVDDMEKVAARFNEEVRSYKARKD